MQLTKLVNPISSSAIKKANALATKCVKSWIGLTQSTSVVVLHHLAVLNIPFLESYSIAAKLSYLSAVSVSDNPLIKEIAFLHSSSAFQKEAGITLATTSALLLANKSPSDINKMTLTN